MPGKLCVVLRATQEPIGGVGFGPEKRTVDVGVSYIFHREQWGHGYAREAVSAALTWAFELLAATEVPHITAVTVVANQRSRRLLDAIGMTHIDTIDHDHGQVMIYAIDRPTWMQRGV